MVYHAQHTSRGEKLSENQTQRRKQRQQLESFHLLHIVRYLQKGGEGNKA